MRKKQILLYDEVVIKITQMNRVGVARIKKCARTKHPRANIDKHIAIIRDIAKLGVTGVAKNYGFSEQYASKILDRYYKMALEIERGADYG